MTVSVDRRDVLAGARRPPELVGTNPNLDAIDAGHFGRSRSKDEPALPDRLCRADGEAWPCAAIIDARRAAGVRARR